MNIEAMEIVCYEKFVFTSVWDFLQSMKSLVEMHTKCSDLELSSEVVGLGSLIVTCRS